MLRDCAYTCTHHRADYLRAHAHVEAFLGLENSETCPTCDRADTVEDVPHVLFCCSAYAVLRARVWTALFECLRKLVGAHLFNAFLASF